MCVCVCITNHTLSSIIRSNSKFYFTTYVKDNNPNYPNPNFADGKIYDTNFHLRSPKPKVQKKKKKTLSNAIEPKANHLAIVTQSTKSKSLTTINKMPQTIEVERENNILKVITR